MGTTRMATLSWAARSISTSVLGSIHSGGWRGTVAGRVVEIFDVEGADDAGDGALDLKLIGVAGLDDDFGQAVGREEDAQAGLGRQGGAGGVVAGADDGGRGGEVAGVGVIAAEGGDGFHEPGLAAASRQAVRLLPVVVVEYCG